MILMKATRRARALVLGALVALCLVFFGDTRDARAVNDPSLAWRTIDTPHFRVTYHSGLERLAQRVASLCESIYGRMTLTLGWEPREITEQNWPPPYIDEVAALIRPNLANVLRRCLQFEKESS